jgi:serine/threonine protein kinase
MGEQMRAEELSLRATIPPAQVPGYKLERLLGQGAFGQVWIGTNLNTGRTVAVKFYLHRGGVNWSLLSREVKNLVSMSGNRLIVQVLEVGWDSEPPYYVMEYLENGSLEDLIRKRGQIPLAEAVALFVDIARGLNHSHGKGVLHCDLKPANVLLDPDLRPRLADFGQSRLTDEQTPSLGTLFYMAPEQADLNASPDARWDVYALGAILYCMLVGTPPYRNPDTVTTLDTATSLEERLKRYRDTIFKSHFPKAHYRVPGMDRWLTGLIDRCLAKKPEDRFQNVQQVIEAVERRNLAKLNLPLKLLGIVGPILLLVVMAIFFWRGVGVAERESSAELKEMVMQNNLFAARLGARTMEKEIESLFESIEEEATRPDLRKKIQDFLTEAGADYLRSLSENASEKERSRLGDLEQQNVLEAFLEDRFRELTKNSAVRSQSPKFDSLFLTDHLGTMIAWVSSDEFAATRVGSNFSYRDYFNGQAGSGEANKLLHSYSPITHTHLSTPFLSTTTNRWKIAVSTPVRSESEITNDSLKGGRQDSQIIGVLVLTIQLGDLDLLPRDLPKGRDNSAEAQNRLAVLVDGHSSSNNQDSEGTILQHVGFAKMSWNNMAAPDKAYRIDKETLQVLKQGGTAHYQDPLALHPDCSEFSGNWIAAMARVEFPNKQLRREQLLDNSGLWVLVQARSDSVTAPVARMANQMIREGIIATLILVVLIFSLWGIVVWGMRLPENFRAAVRSQALSSDRTNAVDDITIDANR